MSLGRVGSSLLAGVLLLEGAAAAEYAYSSPRGIYTVKVPGATPAVPKRRTYLGIQLLPNTSCQGLVGAVNGNSVSLENLGSHTAVADAVRKSYLHVLTGAGRGFVVDINEFRTSDIVCAENVSTRIQPWTQVLIRPHPLLSDLLGADNKFGFGAGTSAATADNIVVWDPDTQHERVYYYHSTRLRWEEKGVTANAGNAIFRFPYGFYVVRRSSGTLRIALSGEIGANAILLPVRPAANVFSLPLNLSGSLDAMVRTNEPYAVISGRNAKLADILTFEEPTTGLQRGPFYHLSRPNASGWREVGVDGSAEAIQPLDFLSTLILRRDGGAGYVFVEGSMTPPATPRPALPPDPEAGEVTLRGELPWPAKMPSDLQCVVEISKDLQTWEIHSDVKVENGKAFFDLPPGQTRAFYRLKISLAF